MSEEKFGEDLLGRENLSERSKVSNATSKGPWLMAGDEETWGWPSYVSKGKRHQSRRRLRFGTNKPEPNRRGTRVRQVGS